MSTAKSYNNGIFIAETKRPDITVGHIDMAHIMHLNKGNSDVTHLGTLEPFLLSGYMPRKPMFVDALKPESVIYVEPNGTGRYDFSIPVPAPETILIEDISGLDKPGLDGSPFKLRFNRKFTGRTSIVKFALSSDVEFHVMDYERVGDYYDYTLQIQAVDAKDKYAPKEWLKPGQRIYISSSAISEYGTVYNDINEQGEGGERKFYNYVGSANANVHFTVTREGAYSSVDGSVTKSLASYADMITMYEFAPGTIGYFNQTYSQTKISSPGEIYRKKYDSDKKAVEAMNRDLVRVAVIPKVEYIAKMQVLADAQHQAVWGTGGAIKSDGGVTSHLPVGLWFQMQKGNYYTYNVSDFSLEMIEKYITDIYKYKMNPYNGESNMIIVKTGVGGYELAKKQIEERHKNRGFVIQDKDYVSGSGFHMGSLAREFDYYDFAYGTIKFEIDPSFDPIGRDDIENPKVNVGRFATHHLSSYVFMIPDLSGEGNNIVEVRKKNYWDFAHYVVEGKLRYPISGGVADVNGGQAFRTGDVRLNHGFQVFMEKPHVAYWMKDPSKALVIRPFNPVTGRAFLSSYFD